MKKRLVCKRGSYLVYLVFFFAAVLIMVNAVIRQSILDAISEATENLGRLWGNSITAEYDRELYGRYGFIGYYGNEEMVKEKLKLYSDYSFKGKNYIDCGEIRCDLSDFHLSDIGEVRKQIRKTMLSGWTPEKDIKEDQEIDEGEVPKGSADRYISAEWIIAELPSKRKSENTKGGNILVDAALETEYIFKVFKDHVDKRDLKETYFENEVEYIISGKLDDEKARKSVYNRLLLERNALNLAYLYSSSEKREAALAMAELLTPGPAAIVTQGLILETWALLEAMNDIELLYEGERVPLVKCDDNWALSIEGAVNEVGSKAKDGKPHEIERELDTEKRKRGCVRPNRIEGLKYEGYLRTLLATTSEKTRILRIMDLIQINMKYTYCDYFLWNDYFTGLYYKIEVNGETHEFTEKYR